MKASVSTAHGELPPRRLATFRIFILHANSCAPLHEDHKQHVGGYRNAFRPLLQLLPFHPDLLRGSSEFTPVLLLQAQELVLDGLPQLLASFSWIKHAEDLVSRRHTCNFTCSLRSEERRLGK